MPVSSSLSSLMSCVRTVCLVPCGQQRRRDRSRKLLITCCLASLLTFPFLSTYGPDSTFISIFVNLSLWFSLLVPVEAEGGSGVAKGTRREHVRRGRCTVRKRTNGDTRIV